FNRIFFGLDTTPYHIFNVLLHSIVTTLVYKATSNAAMLFDGTCTEKLAFHAALLFAVHPVHSEAVANIVGRAELLMAMFALLTVNVYIECLKMGEFTLERKCTLLALSLLALFSKEQGIIALVANIVGRAELLMAMFALLTVNVYIECLKMGEFTLERKCTLLALSFLALFSKEQGIIALVNIFCPYLQPIISPHITWLNERANFSTKC
uniref:TMTC3 n=1 Tax=Ascaris lumbricoides TaxID=6252 RepID=A0A0M3IQ31_ASCLU